ncbi:MAG: M1 family metallopeptidase [Anaerolineae bacterium]
MHTVVMLTILCTGLLACIPSAPPRTAAPPPPTATPVSWYSEPQAAIPTSSDYLPEHELSGSLTDITCPDPEDTSRSAIQYSIEAALDYEKHHVRAIEYITVLNTEDSPLSEIVLYVHPNKQPGLFALGNIAIDGQPPMSATLEGVRLAITLPSPLETGCHTVIRLAFTLQIPPIGNPHFPRQGFLGYGENQLNLGLWFPAVAVHRQGEWLTPQPVNIGEQSVLPTADFHVRLYVQKAPEGLVVVGPGKVTTSANRWEFELLEAREIAFSMSNRYHRLEAVTEDGIQIELYTLENIENRAAEEYNAPEHALQIAARAATLFAGLYGPYPYERLAVVESVFPDGLEFSGLVFVGGEWFRSYTGDPAGYLTLITAHEVAHQWWYHLVGNDQSSEPWLDEALCIYHEYVFLQENYPDLTEWWWAFRVNAFSPEGFVDSSVYEFATVRDYINAVYLRGAQFLHAVREEIGTEAFFDWLESYTTSMRGQIATADDLWRALSPHRRQLIAPIQQQFLRHPPRDDSE